MDNQNYAAQFYSGISSEIELLEKNIEEYPASSVARFMWLYHLKKNNASRLNEVAKQTGIYLNNPLWMEYQLAKSILETDTVNDKIPQKFILENESSENHAEEIISQSSEEIDNKNPDNFNEEKHEEELLPKPVSEEISQNFILENESSENHAEEKISQSLKEIENKNPGDFNEEKHEEELLPEPVSEEIPQNFISGNESSENYAEEINQTSEEIENKNPDNFNEEKHEEELLPEPVNEEISQNFILENDTQEINTERSEEIENEKSLDLNEQKHEEEFLPEPVNEEISQNFILENDSSENNAEETNQTLEQIENKNPDNFKEEKHEEELLPEPVNEEISQNFILENESSENNAEEIITQPSEEIEHGNAADIIEQNPEEETTPDAVNEEIPPNPILENEEYNINEDEYLNKKNSAEVNQIVSDKTFRDNENCGEETIVPFEPLHTVDYFASQGIKLSEEALANDQLGKQVKSFTAWLKTMKKLHPGQLPEQNEVIEKIIQSSSDVSNQNANVLTEAMAEVLVKQGKREKAVEMYEKLSLINPSKSAYFAAKIENLKTV